MQLENELARFLKQVSARSCSPGVLQCSILQEVGNLQLMLLFGCFLAPVAGASQNLDPQFLSSLFWNQTCLLVIDLHIQETLEWLLKSFLVGTVTIYFFF